MAASPSDDDDDDDGGADAAAGLLLLSSLTPDGEATEADDDSDVPGHLVDRDGETAHRNELDDDGELRDADDGRLNASEDDDETTIKTTNFDDKFMVADFFLPWDGLFSQTSVDGWVRRAMAAFLFRGRALRRTTEGRSWVVIDATLSWEDASPTGDLLPCWCSEWGLYLAEVTLVEFSGSLGRQEGLSFWRKPRILVPAILLKPH